MIFEGSLKLGFTEFLDKKDKSGKFCNKLQRKYRLVDSFNKEIYDQVLPKFECHPVKECTAIIGESTKTQ